MSDCRDLRGAGVEITECDRWTFEKLTPWNSIKGDYPIGFTFRKRDRKVFIMNDFSSIDGVTRAIQLAISPVFLLSAIATILSVLTNRLGRVTERARTLKAKLEDVSTPSGALLHSEIAILSKRAKLIDYAITLCTITSLLVCAVIATLFLGTFFNFGINIIVMVLFIIAMVSLVSALLCLLREILMATLKLVNEIP
jgi:hypothetical protein